MARRKKKRANDGTAEDGPVVLPRPPEKLARPFADALAGVKVEPPATKKAEPPRAKKGPSPGRAPREPARAPLPAATAAPTEKLPPAYSYEDRVAFDQAFAGVAPLGKPARRLPARQALVPEDALAARAPKGPDPDIAARARLAALVGGGVRFVVRRESDGVLEGEREGSDGRALRELRGGHAAPEAEIDLHGLRADQARARVVAFLRAAKRDGRDVVRIIHGKGLRSEGGAGVLGDAVVQAITSDAAAALVLAFTTASASTGGTGALLVRIAR